MKPVTVALIALIAASPAVASAAAIAAAAAPADRATGVVNVLDFFSSARPGGPDDSGAIQAAIDSSAGTVYFPPGTYVITRPIRISKPIALAGSGASSVIKANICNSNWDPNGSAPLISIRPADASFRGVTLRDLRLDGGCAARDDYGAGEWGAGVEIATKGTLAPGDITVRGLHIADVGGDGITVRGDPVDQLTEPSDVSIEDNVVERWHRNRQGIAVVAGTRVGIRRNQVMLGIPASGVCPAKTSPGTDPTDGNFGIDLETNPSTKGEFITHAWISGNVIRNCNGGINVSNASPRNGIANVSVYDNTVAGFDGLPLKPIQSNITRTYVEFNNLTTTGSKLR